jgi:hypothetical protein
MRKPIGNQGEIRIDQVTEHVGETTPFTDRSEKGFIISHSENGHHHILSGNVEVLERVNVPKGAQILHAIVREPSKLFQDAAVPHETIDLAPGLYEFRIKREFDPFTELARRVAD